MLDKTHDTDTEGTLVSRVMRAIEGRISSRKLGPGARLPSVRDCAEAMEVSKSTVVDAYERLVAEGAIVARRGAGFFVAGQTRPLSLKAIGPELDRAIDPLWLTRQSLQARPETLRPGSGWLPTAWMPDAALQRSLRQLTREDPARRMRYDEPLGYAPLRHQLSRRLAERGTVVGQDGIVLTDSASQSLDLLCRFLLEPGDTVLVDDPGYFNFHALLRAHRARMVGVPFGADGPDMEAFAEAVATHKPRLYVTNAGPQNPTGGRLAPVKAHRILKIAEAHDMLIVEDDVFADLETDHAIRLAAFDGLNRVIQIGSYSKTISAAIRCGYIAVKDAWVEPLVDLKLALHLGNGQMAATLVHHMLTDGTYRRHLDQLRTKLSDAMGRTQRRFAPLGLKPFIDPCNGPFLWTELPGGVDAAEVARYALAQDVILAPGNVFSVTQTARNFMRFNVARCVEPRIYEVLARGIEAAGAGAATPSPAGE